MKITVRTYSVILTIILTVQLLSCSRGTMDATIDIAIETQNTWSAYESNPIISAGDQLEGAYWNDPSVLKLGSGFVMYLTANLEGPGEKVVPFRALSNDGIDWQIDTTPLLPAKGYGGYSTPSAIILNGQVHLFYDIALDIPDFVQAAIHHAVSDDGIYFTEDNNPIFINSSFDWTKREIRAPCVIHDNGLLKMWFAGDDAFGNGIWGIGYATALDSIY